VETRQLDALRPISDLQVPRAVDRTLTRGEILRDFLSPIASRQKKGPNARQRVRAQSGGDPYPVKEIYVLSMKENPYGSPPNHQKA